MGGTDGRDHDARKVFRWDSNSEKWEEMASFNIARISACASFEGTKVRVWGGRQRSDPEKPPCYLSTETFDFEHPKQWSLTENAKDASLCDVQFRCESHQNLVVKCT